MKKIFILAMLITMVGCKKDFDEDATIQRLCRDGHSWYAVDWNFYFYTDRTIRVDYRYDHIYGTFSVSEDVITVKTTDGKTVNYGYKWGADEVWVDGNTYNILFIDNVKLKTLAHVGGGI